MTLFANSIFRLRGVRYRLLEICPNSESAYVIELDGLAPMPQQLPLSELSDCAAETGLPAGVRRLSDVMKAKRDAAYKRIRPLLALGSAIYDPSTRARSIADVADEMGCSEPTLYKDLRRWWMRGQTLDALTPDYQVCGRGQPQATARRGRKPRADYDTYQLTDVDHQRMHAAIKKHFLGKATNSKADAFDGLLDDHYQTQDGNGNSYQLPHGQRPSLRQFLHFLNKHYGYEEVTRARKGNKAFERDHRETLGDVISDCLGVGHRFDVDATVGDVWLVSEASILDIIGKPTIYLVVDRVSRRIAGFYVGLEPASWSGAVEAIVSIAEDKAELCARYGVTYDSGDWPDNGVFPQEFIGDHAEFFCEASDQIAGKLHIVVGNPPALRPDLKPNVECGIKLVQATISKVAPGYDPPENARKRRGKHYEHDACLTLRQFIRLFLEAVIHYNRQPLMDYPRTPDQLARGVEASPRALWNDGIVRRAGRLAQFDPETVRLALWPRARASISNDGIEFNGLYYKADSALVRSWAIAGRKKRVHVEVAFDRRLVDSIYVLPPGSEVQPIVATLTDGCKMYAGYSFPEIAYWKRREKAEALNINEERSQHRSDYRRAVAPVVSEATARLKQAGPVSRDARRASTKPARTEALRGERTESAGPRPGSPKRPTPMGPAQVPPPVIGLPLRNPMGAGSESLSGNAAERLTPGQIARRGMLDE